MWEYWESRFKNEGAMWKHEPSDSAFRAMKLFQSETINKILIPGFGYGRNGKLFIDNRFDVTGIEISSSAIEIARAEGLNCTIHHGSVTSMPYDTNLYEGIFCYALIHLLNKIERRNFLQSCYSQLKTGGSMIFTAASANGNLYGHGRRLSKDRFELSRGLKAFFYDNDSVNKEFSAVGLEEFMDIDEPVKFMDGQESVKLKYVVCRKL
jgi:SAM-dependent methyltransferase